MNRFPNFEKFLNDEGLTWEIKTWTTELYYSVSLPGMSLTYALLQASRVQKADSIPFHELVAIVTPRTQLTGPDAVENIYLLWRLEHGV